MNNQPQEFSPFEPNYFRHYRKREDGRIRWFLENQATGEIVDRGVEKTFLEAKAEMEKAVEKDMKRIARSFGL